MGILDKFFKKQDPLGELAVYLPKKDISKNIGKEDYKKVLAGIIIGDFIASKFSTNEINGNIETIPLIDAKAKITSISVLAIASALAMKEITERKIDNDFAIEECFTRHYKSFFDKYTNVDYSENFHRWVLGKNMKSHDADSALIAQICIIGAVTDDVKMVIRCASIIAKSFYCSKECEKAMIVASVMIFLQTHSIPNLEVQNYFKEQYSENTEFNGSMSWTAIVELSYDKKTVSIEPNIIIIEAFRNFFDSISFSDCMRNGIRYPNFREYVMPLTGAINAAQRPSPEIDRLPIDNFIQMYLPDEFKEFI